MRTLAVLDTTNLFTFHPFTIVQKMKSFVRLLAVGFLMCCLATVGRTQVITSFTPASTNITTVGQTVAIDLMVEGFTNILSFQFPITFDSTVLKLESVSNPFHSSFKTALVVDPNGNNVFVNPNGKLAAGWEAPLQQFPNGMTLSGKKRLFTLNFKVLKACSINVNLSATAPPPGITAPSFQNNTGASLTVNFTSGASFIGGDCPVPPPTYTGVKVIANNIYIPQGEVGCMPVTANDHVNVEAFQYSLKWNTIPVVGFEGVRPWGSALPGFDPSFFAGNNAGGYLIASWAGTQKVTTPNVIAPMYEVCFRAKGAAGTHTIIAASDVGVSGGSAIERPIGGGLAENLWTVNSPVPDSIYIITATPPPGSVAFIADKDTVAPNSPTCVDIKVKNFKGIENAEFAIRYDTTKIQYQSINLGANPLGLAATQYELDPVGNAMVNKGVRHVRVEQNFGAEDYINYVQFRYRGTAMTVADDATIFSVCFKTIGAVDAESEVKITSLSLPAAGIIVPIGVWKAVPISGVPIAITSGLVRIKSALSASVAGTNPTCNGGTNGSIATTTAANGCTGTLTYKWQGPGINAGNMSAANPTGLTAGTYTVTVTCSVGNVSTTASVTLTQPSAVAFSSSPAVIGVTCANDANGAITLSMTGGTAPYSYVWSGPTAIGNTPNGNNLKAGNYKVTVTDASNCAFTNSNNNIVVGAPAGMSTQTTNNNPVKCFNGSDGSITIAVSGGTAPYTVSWTGPNGPAGNGLTISNLKGGLYTPAITDSKGCTHTGQPINVQAPAQAISVTAAPAGDVICFGSPSGKATCTVTGANGNITYSWRNTATGALAATAKDPTNLPCGTYTVSVTDANTCTATSTAVTVNCPTAALSVIPTPTAATCGTNGKICLSITGGWSNKTTAWSAANLTGDCPSGVGSGTYTVTVTDEKGCSVTSSTTVAGPPQFTLDSTITQVSCFGAGNGAITVVPGGGAGGPYDVTWSGTANLTGASISNLQPGTYAPVVKDKEGCTQTFPAYTITSPAAVAVGDTNVTHQVGVGNNGAIQVVGVTGGTSPYTYAWTGPNGYTSTAQNIDNLAPGIYNLTIKDTENCTFTATYEVKADFAASAVLKKGACGLSADGCVTVNIAGTTPGPYTVDWPGNTTGPKTLLSAPADICGFKGGSVYTLTVTNVAGQVFTMQPVSVPVLEPAAVTFEKGEPNEDTKNGFLLLTPFPTTAPLSYKWSNGKTGPALIQLDSGTYQVTITHQVTGCTTVETYHLERQYPAADFKWLEVTDPTCKTAKNGVLKIQFSGADGPGYEYKWAGPSGVIAGATTTTLGGIGAGAYTVTVTDDRGLEFVYDTVLVAQSLLAISTVDELSNINGFQVSGATVCDGQAVVAYSGQVNGVTIAWSNGVTSATNSTLCGGAYSVTVTDGLGCSSVWTDALTAPPGLTASGEPTQAVTCSGACDGKARFIVSGGVAPYQVTWSNGQTDNIANASGFSESIELCGGTYTITVTDKNGITSTQSVDLPEPAPVALTFASQEPSAFSTCDGEIIATATGTTGLTTWTWSVVNRPGKNGTDQRAKALCAGEVVQFSVVDANGCSAVGRDSVPYPPDGCLKIGPVITPNGDNLNDYFGITCIQGLKNVLEIYNRWGQLVYTAENYDSSPNGFLGTKYWDGTSSGQELPEGAYFYVLNYTDEDGNAQQIKGHVTLLR